MMRKKYPEDANHAIDVEGVRDGQAYGLNGLIVSVIMKDQSRDDKVKVNPLIIGGIKTYFSKDFAMHCQSEMRDLENKGCPTF